MDEHECRLDPKPWRYYDGYRTHRDASGIPGWEHQPRSEYCQTEGHYKGGGDHAE